MRWFSRKPTQQKYAQAVLAVTSNLYLHTTAGSDGAPAVLHFTLPDSRYRYLLFCLSAAVAAALVYDEAKQVVPKDLIGKCLAVISADAAERAGDFFDGPPTDPTIAYAYFTQLAKHWSQWPTLERSEQRAKAVSLICAMIHTAESDEPALESDVERLHSLGVWIACRLPTMRRAFIELASH
jgi:hypothetical protein